MALSSALVSCPDSPLGDTKVDNLSSFPCSEEALARQVSSITPGLLVDWVVPALSASSVLLWPEAFMESLSSFSHSDAARARQLSSRRLACPPVLVASLATWQAAASPWAPCGLLSTLSAASKFIGTLTDLSGVCPVLVEMLRPSCSAVRTTPMGL